MRCSTRGSVKAAFVAASLLAVIAGCTSSSLRPVPAKTTLAAPRVALPTVAVEGIACLFIEARINGQGPFRLLVDTGATGLALSPRVAQAAGLKPAFTDAITVTGASGAQQVGSAAIVDRLEAGGFRAERVMAYLLSSVDAENFSQLGSMDGFCGLGVFADVILEIDFPRQQVNVVRPGAEHYPEAVAVAVDHTGAVVRAEIGGQPRRLAIDTGFEGNFELPLDGLALRGPRTRAGRVISLGGSSAAESGQLDGDVRVGPVAWINPPVGQGTDRIGARTLQTWRLAVDQHAGKIYFLDGSLRRQWFDRTDGPVPLGAGRPPLVWDALEKTNEPKSGESAARFVFHVTNRSSRAVTITNVRPSCGCTVVEAPPSPWVLAPGAKGELTAIVDFRGKDGELAKSLFVATNEGLQTLTMRVKVPPMDETARRANQQLAQIDRQAVFQGDCAVCHAAPATGLYGESLFHAACGSCHLSPHRASMVPDLLVAREKRDAVWWTKWVAEGKDGTLMPAFAEQRGGPLSPGQVESLVEYVLANLPTEPRKD